MRTRRRDGVGELCGDNGTEIISSLFPGARGLGLSGSAAIWQAVSSETETLQLLLHSQLSSAFARFASS